MLGTVFSILLFYTIFLFTREKVEIKLINIRLCPVNGIVNECQRTALSVDDS